MNRKRRRKRIPRTSEIYLRELLHNTDTLKRVIVKTIEVRASQKKSAKFKFGAAKTISEAFKNSCVESIYISDSFYRSSIVSVVTTCRVRVCKKAVYCRRHERRGKATNSLPNDSQSDFGRHQNRIDLQFRDLRTIYGDRIVRRAGSNQC